MREQPKPVENPHAKDPQRCGTCKHCRMEHGMNPQDLKRYPFCYHGPYQMVSMLGPQGMTMLAVHPQVPDHGVCGQWAPKPDAAIAVA